MMATDSNGTVDGRQREYWALTANPTRHDNVERGSVTGNHGLVRLADNRLTVVLVNSELRPGVSTGVSVDRSMEVSGGDDV